MIGLSKHFPEQMASAEGPVPGPYEALGPRHDRQDARDHRLRPDRPAGRPRSPTRPSGCGCCTTTSSRFPPRPRPVAKATRATSRRCWSVRVRHDARPARRQHPEDDRPAGAGADAPRRDPDQHLPGAGRGRGGGGRGARRRPAVGLRRRRLRRGAAAADHPLIGRPDNVMLTPHSAAQTGESLKNMATGVARDVARVLRGEPPEKPVQRSRRAVRRAPAARPGLNPAGSALRWIQRSPDERSTANSCPIELPARVPRISARLYGPGVEANRPAPTGSSGFGSADSAPSAVLPADCDVDRRRPVRRRASRAFFAIGEKYGDDGRGRSGPPVQLGLVDQFDIAPWPSGSRGGLRRGDPGRSEGGGGGGADSPQPAAGAVPRRPAGREREAGCIGTCSSWVRDDRGSRARVRSPAPGHHSRSSRRGSELVGADDLALARVESA